jgi:hypothetical protein
MSMATKYRLAYILNSARRQEGKSDLAFILQEMMQLEITGASHSIKFDHTQTYRP